MVTVWEAVSSARFCGLLRATCKGRHGSVAGGSEPGGARVVAPQGGVLGGLSWRSRRWAIGSSSQRASPDAPRPLLADYGIKGAVLIVFALDTAEAPRLAKFSSLYAFFLKFQQGHADQ